MNSRPEARLIEQVRALPPLIETTRKHHDCPHLRRPVRSGRARTVTLWTLQILLGAFMIIASAAPKLAGQHYAVEIFDEIGWGQWYRVVVGVVELAGGIGLLVPRLSGLAAAGLSVLALLAAATQTFQLDGPGSAVFPLVLTVVFGGIAWVRRAEIATLLHRSDS